MCSRASRAIEELKAPQRPRSAVADDRADASASWPGAGQEPRALRPDRDAAREVGEQGRHALGEGARGLGRHLGAAQLGGRDHLHGLGDLLRRLHGGDAVAKVLREASAWPLLLPPVLMPRCRRALPGGLECTHDLYAAFWTILRGRPARRCRADRHLQDEVEFRSAERLREALDSDLQLALGLAREVAGGADRVQDVGVPAPHGAEQARPRRGADLGRPGSGSR